MSNEAGKGDRPRNCFSRKFKDNYENINWGHAKSPKKKNENRKNPNRKKV